MKSCEYCGAVIHDEDQFCLQCGKKVKNYNDTATGGTFIYGFFSFFIPLLGFLMYLMLKGTRNPQAKTSIRWAFIGLAFYVVATVILLLFYFYILVEILT